MKLIEIFDKEQAIKDFNKDNEPQDTETSMADMIISQFEGGKISFDDARKKLVDKGLDVWIHELNMAQELTQDKAKMH